MWRQFLLLTVAAGFAIISMAEGKHAKKIVCYFGSWSVYRQGNGQFTADFIDPNLCTHYIYTFVGINANGTISSLDQWNDIDNGGFKKFNAIKNSNPKLKTLVSVGGWNEGSVKFSQVAADPQLRSTFAKNAAEFVKQYGFNGIDVDWEYPGKRGGSPQDKANFVLLIKEMRKIFKKYRYLLIAAVGATESDIDTSYDVRALSKYLDFINVMTYDLHGYFGNGTTGTGENAPLYPLSTEVSSEEKQNNVAACIAAWISKGASPKNLVMGVAAYGHSFTLDDPANNSIGAPSSAAGNAGNYTGQPGVLGYNEICELQKGGQWTVVWNEEQKVPYAYSGNQWVGYDDPQSIAIKVNFAKEYKLGGVMVWSIELDDFRGICGNKYPIISTIKSNL